MKSDPLLSIFDDHLRDPARLQQTEKELIFDVVADFILHLMQMGNVPHHQLDLLEEYLTEEVVEIYRKKTYGFASLKEYRDKKL
jgi:hypothetical protein